MAKAAFSERYMNLADANQRIGQLRSQFVPEKSTNARFVYFVPATGQWLTAQREGGIFRVDFFGECPC